MENVELGRLTVKRIDADPRLFDMRVWAARFPCGTAACLAGHTLLAAGYEFAGANTLTSGFVSPEGVVLPSVRTGDEASRLLVLTDEERYGGETFLNVLGERIDGPGSLFYGLQDNVTALERFREMIDNAESSR